MHLNPSALALVVFVLGAAISFAVAALIKGTFWAIKAFQRPTPQPAEARAARGLPSPELQA